MNQLEQTRGQPPRVDFQIGMRGYTPFSSEKKKEKKKRTRALAMKPLCCRVFRTRFTLSVHFAV